MNQRGRPSGFTLIEVVVALSIMALALGVLYESFGWSLRRTAALQLRETAWLSAQSLLSEVRARKSLRPGMEQGTTHEGFRWEMRIDESGAKARQSNELRAFEVTIDVGWGDGTHQRLRLQSIEASRIES